MIDSASYTEKLAEWNRQAADLAQSNWPSSKIRSHLVQQGCPELTAKKIASRFAKKRGLTVILAGSLMLLGWLSVSAFVSVSGVYVPSLLPLALLVGGIATLLCGLLQFLID